MTKIGLLSGYGVHFETNLKNSRQLEIETPYGKTSSTVISGTYHNNELFIIKRHNNDDSIPSFKVNFKANIYALFELGCEAIISTSVCGSLQEEINTGEFVVFDQFIDLTTQSELTFSDKINIDRLNHSSFHKPFSDEIRDPLIESCIVNGITTHTKGTVVAVDGPRQSTRAESNLFRKWGADVVDTTTTPEAILSHELNIKYAAISLCTYYDSWRTDIPPSTRSEKLSVLELNTENFIRLLKHSLSNIEIDVEKEA